MFHLHLHILIVYSNDCWVRSYIMLYSVCLSVQSAWLVNGLGSMLYFVCFFTKECVASQWSGLYAVYLQLSLSIPGDSLYRGEMWPIGSCQQGQSNYPKPKDYDIDQKYMGSLFVTNFWMEVGTNIWFKYLTIVIEIFWELCTLMLIMYSYFF